MSWLFFAFCGPVLWAVSTHLDKYLVERFFKHSDVAVLVVFTALIGVLALPLIAFYQPTIAHYDIGSIALIVLSGILYMGAMLFYLHALQTEEASVVSPFFQAAPLFGYLLGYAVLGETLSPLQMAGGGLILAGTLIVSVRFDGNFGVFKLRLAVLMLACGLALALSALILRSLPFGSISGPPRSGCSSAKRSSAPRCCRSPPIAANSSPCCKRTRARY